MKPPPFQYYDPTTISEAVSILADCDNAKVIAGGQSLMPMLNMRFVFPDQIVDLNNIAELTGIQQQGDTILIGAMTRQREVEHSDIVAEKLPILATALKHVGHLQTRNRGTIGGSISHLDPAAELVSIATLYDALVSVQGPEGVRELPYSEFVLGYMTPAINFDEIVTGVKFDAWPNGHGHGFREFARRHGDFAIASASVLLTLRSDGSIDRASFTLGGVGSVAVRLPELELALVGENPGENLFREVTEHCCNIEAMGDALVSAEYRQHLAGVLARRAFEEAVRMTEEANGERST